MTCRSVRQWIDGHARSERRPEELEAHLAACDCCHAFAAEWDRRESRLLALSRADDAEPDVERALRSLHAALGYAPDSPVHPTRLPNRQRFRFGKEPIMENEAISLSPRPRVTLPFRRVFGGRGAAALATAAALGGLAGLWVAQQKAPRGTPGDLPSGFLTGVAGQSVDLPVPADAPSVWESREPRTVTSGPARVEIERVRVIPVPTYAASTAHQGDTDGSAQPAHQLVVEGRVYQAGPNKVMMGDNIEVGQPLTATHRVMVPASTNARILAPAGGPSANSQSPEGVPFRAAFNATGENIKGIVRNLSVEVPTASRSEFHVMTFHPERNKAHGMGGRVRTATGERQWRVTFRNLNTQAGSAVVGNMHRRLSAVARVEVEEEGTAHESYPLLAASPPWIVAGIESAEAPSQGVEGPSATGRRTLTYQLALPDDNDPGVSHPYGPGSEAAPVQPVKRPSPEALRELNLYFVPSGAVTPVTARFDRIPMEKSAETKHASKMDRKAQKGLAQTVPMKRRQMMEGLAQLNAMLYANRAQLVAVTEMINKEKRSTYDHSRKVVQELRARQQILQGDLAALNAQRSMIERKMNE